LETGKAKRLLVAPLDWGLGHTSRCIPLIRHLVARGHEVVVAGNETQRAFLAQAFPDLAQWPLEGYGIRYARTRATFLAGMLLQLPRMLRIIRREQQWLRQQLQREQIDGIISDNRYGLYHPEVPSVILTHQLQIHSGLGAGIDRLLRNWHYRRLGHFSEVWVPDVAGDPNLSGTLGHPSVRPKHVKYIGLLSQVADRGLALREEHLLVLLSGPEPQRSILSNLLWEQVQDYPGKVIFVEGSTAAAPRSSRHARVHHHRILPSEIVRETLAAASLVICRSGYSTLMDLVALGKKAILIPTPGQTEQEYLGQHLHQSEIFLTREQRSFCLNEALHAATAFPFRNIGLSASFTQFQPVVDNWLARL
jgi:UDP:flavonoid glycosyltransferase YjiC (YdhE family)